MYKNFIPFHGWKLFHFLCILRFIHSYVDGHLGCFYLLVVNGVAVNIGMQTSLQAPTSNSLRYTPRIRIAGSYENSMFTFWGTSILFSIAATPFYIPPTVHEGSNFSTSLSTLVLFFFFNSAHPKGCKVVSHCGF